MRRAVTKMATTNQTRGKRAQKLLAFLLSVVLVLSLFAGSFNFASAADTEQSSPFSETELALLDAIDTDFILENIEYVHNNIGPRVAGTPADEASAAYFAGVLESLGYEPFSLATAADGTDDYFETIDNNATVNNRIGASVTINGRTYGALAPGWSDESVYQGYNTPTVTAETVYFENVDDAVAADAADIEGKIVLTNRKSLTEWARNSTAFADAARALEAKGAAAVVFFYSKYTVSEDGATSSERAFPAPTTGDVINIPVVLATYLDGRAIVKALTDGDTVTSTTATVVNRRNTHTSNILAIKEAETPSDKYVIVGAHRDSVTGAEGVNDNLSGTVNVLAIAKALQEIPTDYNVIFALWAAEEDGLIGSKYFYSEFLYPDNWGVEHVVAYYNMDMAAPAQTRNSVLTVHTPYRDENRQPLQSVAADVAEAQAERYWDYTDGAFADWWTEGPDDLVDLQYFGSCSDHASITGATGANGTEKLAFGEGIPSVYIFWGDNIGDGRNDVTEQNYHVVGDIYEWPEDEDQFIVVSDTEYFSGNYSIERAQILASVFALSVYNTAAAPIDGIEDGETYYGDTAFTVAYNYRDSVSVDGEAVTLDETGAYVILADGEEHTIVVTDVFGNTATYTATIDYTYTVTFVADETVVAEKTVNAGAALTEIPEIPAKEGYTKIDPVWDVTDFSAITSDLTVNAVYTPDPIVLPFTDIDPEEYYYEALVWGYEDGVVAGTTETTFSPSEEVTRAQIVAFLYRLAGSPASGTQVPFTDVSAEAYYAQALAWAVEQKIAYGVSATAFEPDRAVTREEFVSFLYRYAQLQGNIGGEPADLSGFQDAASVSAWAKNAVEWAVRQGIAVGVETDVLAPQGTATRAQAIAFLYRYSQLG